METEKKDGAFVGLVIIIIILAVGGVYIWKSKVKELEMQKAQNAAITAEDANSINALEQELKNTNTDIGVDASSIK